MMKDTFERQINYIRVAVTDRCNLRCRYCMPAEGVASKKHEDILSYEEIEQVLAQCVKLGINRFRITGGEPLVRRGIVGFVERLHRMPGVEEINLTTNGILLSEYAGELRAAGVRNLNISLDTLRAERFEHLTRGGDLRAVLRGIEDAYKLGFEKIKINAVIMRGVNEDEIGDFMELIRDRKLYLRFIELMPIGEAQKEKVSYVSMDEIMRALPPLVRDEGEKGMGPAEYFRAEGYLGTIGFIHPVSRCFCGECNRIRLTSDGKLMPCLHADTEIDLKPYLRPHDADKIREAIRQAVEEKPEKHWMENLKENSKNGRYMNQVGG